MLSSLNQFLIVILTPTLVSCVDPMEELRWKFDDKYFSLFNYIKWELLENKNDSSLKEMCIEHCGTSRSNLRSEPEVMKLMRHHIYYDNSYHIRMVRLDLLQCNMKYLDAEDEIFYLAEGDKPDYVFKLEEIGDHFKVTGQGALTEKKFVDKLPEVGAVVLNEVSEEEEEEPGLVRKSRRVSEHTGNQNNIHREIEKIEGELQKTKQKEPPRKDEDGVQTEKRLNDESPNTEQTGLQEETEEFLPQKKSPKEDKKSENFFLNSIRKCLCLD